MSSHPSLSHSKSKPDDNNMEKYHGRSHDRGNHRSRSRSRKRSSYRQHGRSRSRSKSHKRITHRGRRSHSRSPQHHSRRRRSHSRSSKRYHRRSHRSRSHSRSLSRSHSRSRRRNSVSKRSRSRSHTRNKRRSQSKSKLLSSSTSRQNYESCHTNNEQEKYRANDKFLVQNSTSGISGRDSVKSEERSQSRSSSPASVRDYPVPRGNPVGDYYNLKDDEPIDKEKIHKEIEEKLRLALAKEGKVYPLPKPEPSHPVFANDGSFIEIFKKMQQQQQTFDNQDMNVSQSPTVVPTTPTTTTVASLIPKQKPTQPPPPPVFGRRRGGKILKTGMVAKPKLQSDLDNADPKDFWAIYLREVKKYKNTACDSDGKTRPLVK